MTTEIRYFTKEDALQAVTEEGNELGFCAPDLQYDEDVVMTAIKKWVHSFQYASDELKSNKAFILKAIHEGVYPEFLLQYTNYDILYLINYS